MGQGLTTVHWRASAGRPTEIRTAGILFYFLDQHDGNPAIPRILPSSFLTGAHYPGPLPPSPWPNVPPSSFQTQNKAGFPTALIGVDPEPTALHRR